MQEIALQCILVRHALAQQHAMLLEVDSIYDGLGSFCRSHCACWSQRRLSVATSMQCCEQFWYLVTA
jgi:hypothetical protein